MSVVSIDRFKEKGKQEIIDFIGDDKFLVVKFDEFETVDIISNFMPGLAETTLLHIAYMYAAQAMFVDMDE
jgi:hypothetical protein